MKWLWKISLGLNYVMDKVLYFCQNIQTIPYVTLHQQGLSAYIAGKVNYIADSLSRPSLSQTYRTIVVCNTVLYCKNPNKLGHLNVL